MIIKSTTVFLDVVQCPLLTVYSAKFCHTPKDEEMPVLLPQKHFTFGYSFCI